MHPLSQICTPYYLTNGCIEKSSQCALKKEVRANEERTSFFTDNLKLR